MESITSREFNQNISLLKKKAEKGKVYVTNRGKNEYVFMKYEEFKKLVTPSKTLAEMFSMDDVGTEDFTFEEVKINGFKDVEF